MTNRTRCRMLLSTSLAACLCAAACSGADGTSGANDTAPAIDGADVGTGNPDVGEETDGDVADDDLPSEGLGVVQLSQRPADASSEGGYTASARFYEGTEQLRESCETTREAGCRLEICQGHLDLRRDLVSAGEISIFGGAQSIELTPDSEKTYDASGKGTLWTSDTVLTVRASGGEVPGFLAELEPDIETRLVKPWLPDPGEPLQVDPSRNLPVEWKRENLNSGKFGVVLNSESDGRETTIECVWDAESGQERVDSSLLKQMARAQGRYQFTVGASETFEEGGWRVKIEAWQPVDDGSDMTAYGVGPLNFR